jgi:ligand-binding SRPBCC domain-containing protein
MRPIYRLDTWLWLPRSREEVFAFFADAANLERITPTFVAFDMTTPRPVEMRQGTVIDYRIGLRGLKLTWRSEIASWDPPARFSDVQLRGPYREWEHTHLFEERDGGTQVTDSVRYALPGPGFAAALVNSLVVAPDLKRIFTFRHEALRDAFGAGGDARAGAVEISRAA